MDETQIEICAHAQLAGLHGGGISVDPELEEDAEGGSFSDSICH